MTSPSPAEVIKLREGIQSRFGLGITASQDRCAALLHTSRRSWQQWERGERNIHPAFWELVQIKSAMLTARNQSSRNSTQKGKEMRKIKYDFNPTENDDVRSLKNNFYEALKSLEHGNFEVAYPEAELMHNGEGRIRLAPSNDQPYLLFNGMNYLDFCGHVRAMIDRKNQAESELRKLREQIKMLQNEQKRR